MQRPPRDPSEPLLDRATLQRLATQAALVAAIGLAAFGLARVSLGLDTAGAQTMTFLAMSAGQVLTVFNVRTDRGSGFRGASRNPWLWGALAITAILEASALTIPPLRDVLGLTALPATGWAIAGALAIIPLASVQTIRILRDR